MFRVAGLGQFDQGSWYKPELRFELRLSNLVAWNPNVDSDVQARTWACGTHGHLGS